MQTQAITRLPRGKMRDDQSSALAYWGTGFAGIVLMLAFCFVAGLRF
jgi:hypothetical protein